MVSLLAKPIGDMRLDLGVESRPGGGDRVLHWHHAAACGRGSSASARLSSSRMAAGREGILGCCLRQFSSSSKIGPFN
jgi:hypothetical protein